MIWQKKGRIFVPEEYPSPWVSSHASVPIAEYITDNLYRVYFSTRDNKNRSHVGYFEIDAKNPSNILMVSDQPVLNPGSAGNFDDAGTMACWIVNHKDQKWMYYIGWNLSVQVPFRNALGLAISRDGGLTFERYSQGPIMDRGIYDPTLVASACVLQENDVWRMWYTSGLNWIQSKTGNQGRYHIKYAQSKDGINWKRTGLVCIDFQNADEYAISRPCVIKESGMYRMWYSYRGPTYKIGYAESSDGTEWVRKDRDVGINTSPTGWDSEMIEYPFVFQHGKQKIMLYNGNGYGQTGIGYAVLDE